MKGKAIERLTELTIGGAFLKKDSVPMARSNQKVEVAKLSKLLQFPLFPDEVAQVQAIKATEKDVVKAMQQRLSEGWRFDVMLNNKGDGYSVLVKFSGVGDVDSGVGFYANGDTLLTALMVALYKIELPGEKSVESFLESRQTQSSIG